MFNPSDHGTLNTFRKNTTFLLSHSRAVIRWPNPKNAPRQIDSCSIIILGGPEKGRLSYILVHLGTFTTDSSCQLDVLWHDGDSLGVDGAEVSVFEDSDQVSFTGFLEGHDSG